MTSRVRRAFLAAPAEGTRAVLDPEESHHVARVLRARAGETLAVFDGRGGEWSATVDAIAGERVTVLVGPPADGVVEPRLRVVLHQAIVRPEKLEWVLQKGTELGVAAFRLIETERGERAPSAARLARYERIAMEACKQSGRRVVPAVDAAGRPQTPPPGVLALALHTSPDAAPLAALLAGAPAKEVWIAIGPEGGFAPGEIAALVDAGWRPASLGPRTLRTETAGAVAAAIVLHAWGDLGSIL